MTLNLRMEFARCHSLHRVVRTSETAPTTSAERKMDFQIANQCGARRDGAVLCMELFSEFRARKGLDSTMPEATAGSGCLVGHSKHRGKTETITSWKLGLARTARLLSRPNHREPEKHGCSLGLHSVAASKTQPSTVRNLLAGGRCAGNGAPQKPVIRSPRNRRGRGFDSRRVHQFAA